MAAVTLRKVAKAYGAIKVIHDVDLAIPDRAFAVLVGPSGCGKSTLLRMIAGLEDMSAGEVVMALAAGEVELPHPRREEAVSVLDEGPSKIVWGKAEVDLGYRSIPSITCNRRSDLINSNKCLRYSSLKESTKLEISTMCLKMREIGARLQEVRVLF